MENQKSLHISRYSTSTKSNLSIHYASANLSITPETAQQLVHAWPQSLLKLCTQNDESNTSNTDDNKEENINNFDDNWH